ncbi:AP-3 complex subunit sigma [Vitis vinifera]|uniref:AP-3 complex subunit sigma n=1 Tax=Vitis vinifera TaxID=29760 RepID=A0A438EVY2_VITVI|nr:AP-3 complex subunit sigma [Vitis vinifera]
MLRKCPSGINKGVVVLVWATTLPIYRGRGGVGHVARGDSEEDMIRAPPEKQQELIRRVFGGLSSLSFLIDLEFLFLCSRAENVSNFVEADSVFGPDTRLVYKHYATLYFVFVFDSSENELAMLDLIQVLVETLDKCFKNVCELDIVFNYSKLHTILDEIIFGGQVLETSSAEVMKAVEEISRLSLSLSLLLSVSVCLCWKHPQILSHLSLRPFLVGEVDNMHE